MDVGAGALVLEAGGARARFALHPYVSRSFSATDASKSRMRSIFQQSQSCSRMLCAMHVLADASSRTAASWRETSGPAESSTEGAARDAPELAAEAQLLGEQLGKHLRLRLASAEHPVELVDQALVADRNVQLHPSKPSPRPKTTRLCAVSPAVFGRPHPRAAQTVP